MSLWWGYIKTDCPATKVAYILRNWSFVSGGDPDRMMKQLAHVAGVDVKCHRNPEDPRNNGFGSYSVVCNGNCWLVRIDPTTPGIHGPRHEPSLVVTHQYRVQDSKEP